MLNTFKTRFMLSKIHSLRHYETQCVLCFFSMCANSHQFLFCQMEWNGIYYLWINLVILSFGVKNMHFLWHVFWIDGVFQSLSLQTNKLRLRNHFQSFSSTLSRFNYILSVVFGSCEQILGGHIVRNLSKYSSYSHILKKKKFLVWIILTEIPSMTYFELKLHFIHFPSFFGMSIKMLL